MMHIMSRRVAGSVSIHDGGAGAGVEALAWPAMAIQWPFDA